MTRVLVVAAVRLYRDGLSGTLGHESGLEAVPAASSCREALEILETHAAEVVVLDAALPDAHSAARKLALVGVPAVVVIGVTEDEAEVITWAEDGVAGYVNRDSPLTDLLDAIRSAGRGELLCSPRVAGTLLRRVNELSKRVAVARPACGLTVRELEVMRLLDEGLSNKEIAQRLWIELPTVKNHVRSILEKLEVPRRAQAVTRARREGILGPTSRQRSPRPSSTR